MKKGSEHKEREPKPSLFIAYVQADENMARWVQDVCQANGYRTILKAYLPGSNEILDTDRGLRQAKHTRSYQSNRYSPGDNY